MPICRAYLGIDSHLRTTTICAPAPEDGEPGTRTSGGNDYGEMAERMADFPQPSHGACEGGRADSCRHGCRRVATRRRGPWPPRGLPARPTRAPGRTTGATRGPCAARPGRGGRPGLGAPRAGRGAARAGPGDGRPGLRPRGGAPARECDPVPIRRIVGRAHADRQAREAPVPAPPGPAAPRRTGRRRVAGDCLAAPSAAESAEVACDGPGARAEGIARAPGPGPPVVAPVRARGAGPPLGARALRRGGRPLPPLVRAKGRVPPRPRALGGPGRRGPEAGPHLEERTGARAQASHRGCLGPRAGQPGVPQGGRDAGAPRDPRARAGLPGKAPRTSQGAGLPRPGAPRG